MRPSIRKKEKTPGFFLRVLFLALLVLVGRGGMSFGEDGRNLEPDSRILPEDSLAVWPHETGDLAPDPALHFGRLANGFRYVLMKNREPRDRVSMHLNVQVGSAYEREDEQGLAHFLEHMLFNGSTHFAPGELVKYFQRIGMQFGPDANAHTGFFETVYDILLPKGEAKDIDEALVVFKDFAQGALLLESEIDRERQVVLAEKRERDSAPYRTYVEVSKFEFKDSILSRRFPIGTQEVLLALDRRRVRAFYDRWYRPDKMILVMVGDFEVKAAVSRITAHFGDLAPRSGKPEEPDLGKIRHVGIQPFYHFEAEAGSTEVGIGVMQSVPRRPDTRASRLAAWKKEAAHRMVQDRLDAVLASADPPFSSASIGAGLFAQEVEYAQIGAQCNPDQWKNAFSQLERTLRKALVFGFTESETRRMKQEIAAELDIAVKGAATRNSRYLARKLISSLNNGKVFLSPEQEKALLEDAVSSLTPQAAHAALVQAWAANHRLLVVTGNASVSGPDLPPAAQIRAAFEESRMTAVNKPAFEEAVRFPYLPEPEKPGEILRRIRIPELDILQVDFQNGVRLNLKKTDFAANEVRATLAFGYGRSGEPEDQAGLGVFAEAQVNESGLGRLNRHELDRALAGRTAQVAFRVSEDRFELKGTSATEETRLLFQLMAAHLLDPAFRPEAERLILERFRQVYAEIDHSVEDAMRLLGTRFLAGNDGRFGYPPWDQFARLSLEKARNWLSDSFKQAQLELSVVGDIDVDKVVSLASLYFGSLEPRSGFVRPRPVTGIRFPSGESRTVEIDTRIPKSLVVITFPTEDLWDIGRSRRLNVVAEVLSERLREAIRENRGAAYAPTAYHDPSRTYSGYGILWIIAYADPEADQQLVAAVQETVALLAGSSISAEELQRAVDPIRTAIKDRMRRNGYWLDTVLVGSRLHPEQLEWSRTIAADYASISPGEITRLARTYLEKSRAAVLVFQPKKRVP